MCSPRSGGCHCVLWFDFPVRQTQCSNSVRDNKLYSRYPGKSVSSEVERNWVKMGGQMEVGELLGHKKNLGILWGFNTASGGSCIILGFN